MYKAIRFLIASLMFLISVGTAHAGVDRIGGGGEGPLPFLGSFSIEYIIRDTLMYELAELRPPNVIAFHAYMSSNSKVVRDRFFEQIDPTVEKYMRGQPQVTRAEVTADATMMVEKYIEICGEVLLVRSETKSTLVAAVMIELNAALLKSGCEKNARN